MPPQRVAFRNGGAVEISGVIARKAESLQLTITAKAATQTRETSGSIRR